jgi:hypothetical protein
LEEVADVLKLWNRIRSETTVVSKYWEDALMLPAGVLRVKGCQPSEDLLPSLL